MDRFPIPRICVGFLLALAGLPTAAAGDAPVVLVGRIAEVDVQYRDFGRGYASVYAGNVVIRVERVERASASVREHWLQGDSAERRAVIRYRSEQPPAWAENSGLHRFHLQPLAHTRDFAVVRVGTAEAPDRAPAASADELAQPG